MKVNIVDTLGCPLDTVQTTVAGVDRRWTTVWSCWPGNMHLKIWLKNHIEMADAMQAFRTCKTFKADSILSS